MTNPPNPQKLNTRQMAWLVSNRVLYWKLSPNAELRDFHDGMTMIESLLQDNNDTMHVILNARSLKKLLGDMNTELYSLVKRIAKHNRMGNFNVMTTNMMVKHHINRVTAPFGTQLRYSNSFRNAWQALRERDTRLPSVTPQLPKFTPTKKPRRTK